MRFGRLLIISRKGREKRGYFWLGRCDCGKEKLALTALLLDGRVKSCGCLASDLLKKRNHTHGRRHTSTYRIWDMMLQRCENPLNAAYEDYGGRGITVCAQWKTFKGFFDDMGDRPPTMSLDRVDNNLGYFPGNCRWATRYQQSRNKRNNRWVELNGKRMLLVDALKQTGLFSSTFYRRIKRGMSMNDAINLPGRTRCRKSS